MAKRNTNRADQVEAKRSISKLPDHIKMVTDSGVVIRATIPTEKTAGFGDRFQIMEESSSDKPEFDENGMLIKKTPEQLKADQENMTDKEKYYRGIEDMKRIRASIDIIVLPAVFEPKNEEKRIKAINELSQEGLTKLIQACTIGDSEDDNPLFLNGNGKS